MTARRYRRTSCIYLYGLIPADVVPRTFVLTSECAYFAVRDGNTATQMWFFKSCATERYLTDLFMESNMSFIFEEEHVHTVRRRVDRCNTGLPKCYRIKDGEVDP